MDESIPPPPYSFQDPSPRPPATPSTRNVDNAGNGTAVVSGAAYFAMRLPTQPKPRNTLPRHIAVLPDSTPADLPMPKPEQILIDRDVTPHDWLTFVNHVFFDDMAHQSSHPMQEKGRKERLADMSATRSLSNVREREGNISIVIEDWNQGFFQPRGIEIIARFKAMPSTRPTPVASSSHASVPRPPAGSISMSGQKDRPKQNRDAELGLALHRAVEKQDIKTSKVLLEAGADPDARPSWETPMIVEAVKKKNTELVQLILAYGPDIEAYAPGGETALYNAVSKGESDIVELLLAHGADPNKHPYGSEPALYKAVSKQYDQIVELLLQHRNINIDDAPLGGSTALYQAAKKGNIHSVQILIAAGANVDAKPMGQNTAMFEAAKQGNYVICKTLLENGAKVDARTIGGETALWNIVGKKELSLIQLLLDNGANINAKAWAGESPVQKAVRKGKQDHVELLLQYRQPV